MDEKLSTKITAIEQCLSWIKRQQQSKEWQTNEMIKKELLLNLEKACLASIECTSFLISQKNLAVPKQAREGFGLLETMGVVNRETANHLKKMLAMRGLVAHEEGVKPAMIESFLINEVGGLEDFCRAVKRL